jgi:KUP system potassium uptake protein
MLAPGCGRIDAPAVLGYGLGAMAAAAEHSHNQHPPAPARGGAQLFKLSLGALGVVYGDIGTSPLYAFRECFEKEYGVKPDASNVLGVLSLVFWALTLVVVLKYLVFIMRADNHGEGGILALLALIKRGLDGKAIRQAGMLLLVGLFGAALLYGDGVITPAVSVLGAVEGLEVATPALKHFTWVITIVILVGLFLLQKRGTGGIGALFGPAMLVWFAAIGVTGATWIAKAPEVVRAVSPIYAVHFFAEHKVHGFLMLGAVVLVITGGEALYADMGHFGRRPIRLAWFTVVFPCLLLNYFGQGALLLERGGDPAVVANPFFHMVSGWMIYPMIGIATVAAIIASQALITGAFSLTQQAVQLGYWPRVSIVHTSGETEGQIFIPEINVGLMVACIALVAGFRHSSDLASAYGIAVTGTMAITSILFYVVARRNFGWSVVKAGALVMLFLAVDISFLGANVVKVEAGGWVPLVIGGGMFTLMTTWKRGRERLYKFIKAGTLPMDLFLEDIERRKPHRVSGTAVVMTSNPDGAPPVLLHHFKHTKTLHEQILLLSIVTEHRPEVPNAERIQHIRELGQGIFQVTAAYGFMQTPNVIEVLNACNAAGLATKKNDTSFYLGRETLLITDRPGMARWRKILFSYLSRNARPANAFFHIPPNRVVELGTQIEL